MTSALSRPTADMRLSGSLWMTEIKLPQAIKNTKQLKNPSKRQCLRDFVMLAISSLLHASVKQIPSKKLYEDDLRSMD